MSADFNPIRYDIIPTKNPREIVMLRGSGCKWRRCTFCDYHLDYSRDTEANFRLNASALSQVTGLYHDLEIINSGSFNELDAQTIDTIEQTCLEKGIHDLHFEMHWMHRDAIAGLRRRFESHSIRVHVKMGVETFDADFRDDILQKGMEHASPEDIVPFADDICLLFGLKGQTLDSMRYDLETGLRLFNRVCVNIMTPNTTRIQPDASVINVFRKNLYDIYIDNPRVDILLQNTDFGVGGEANA